MVQVIAEYAYEFGSFALKPLTGSIKNLIKNNMLNLMFLRISAMLIDLAAAEICV